MAILFRSSPEQIRALAEEVLSKKISLTPEQVADLTSKIRDSLAKISNIGAILAETRGNKTLASNLESKVCVVMALEASARAATIKNTTDTVREAIQVAEEAQLAANEAIRSAEEVMKLAREHLDAAKTEADATETRAKEVNASLSTLEGEMKKVKVQYLQIADDAKNAFQLVDKALQAAQTAEQGNKQMTMDIEVAQGLLSARTQGNEAPQKRAEALRQRASKLLYKAQRNSDDISGKPSCVFISIQFPLKSVLNTKGRKLSLLCIGMISFYYISDARSKRRNYAFSRVLLCL
ncbi:unnamed protein product [Strongylus vulgaris]|uniref:Uncharacterized protein n=1 Tax=Strongylus vulgaris TaxID=40348 RepID=A0A3P7IYU9_STRVU|nr:unnamed protein product [Strongylus vulgaris]